MDRFWVWIRVLKVFKLFGFIAAVLSGQAVIFISEELGFRNIGESMEGTKGGY